MRPFQAPPHLMHLIFHCEILRTLELQSISVSSKWLASNSVLQTVCIADDCTETPLLRSIIPMTTHHIVQMLSMPLGTYTVMTQTSLPCNKVQDNRQRRRRRHHSANGNAATTTASSDGGDDCHQHQPSSVRTIARALSDDDFKIQPRLTM